MFNEECCRKDSPIYIDAEMFVIDAPLETTQQDLDTNRTAYGQLVRVEEIHLKIATKKIVSRTYANDIETVWVRLPGTATILSVSPYDLISKRDKELSNLMNEIADAHELGGTS